MPNTVIQSKEEILLEMNSAYQSVSDYINSLDAEAFVFSPNEKWSASNQLEHLILSSKGVASALKMSKLKLMIFGKSKTGSRSYDDLFGAYADVLNTGAKAGPKFSPAPDKVWTKEELLSNWEMIGHKFAERIATWSDKDLDTYRLPHPVLGKLTMREMLYFTIFHARHHLKTMKHLFA